MKKGSLRFVYEDLIAVLTVLSSFVVSVNLSDFGREKDSICEATFDYFEADLPAIVCALSYTATKHYQNDLKAVFDNAHYRFSFYSYFEDDEILVEMHD